MLCSNLHKCLGELLSEHIKSQVRERYLPEKMLLNLLNLLVALEIECFAQVLGLETSVICASGRRAEISDVSEGMDSRRLSDSKSGINLLCARAELPIRTLLRLVL